MTSKTLVSREVLDTQDIEHEHLPELSSTPREERQRIVTARLTYDDGSTAINVSHRVMKRGLASSGKTYCRWSCQRTAVYSQRPDGVVIQRSFSPKKKWRTSLLTRDEVAHYFGVDGPFTGIPSYAEAFPLLAPHQHSLTRWAGGATTWHQFTVNLLGIKRATPAMVKAVSGAIVGNIVLAHRMRGLVSNETLIAMLRNKSCQFPDNVTITRSTLRRIPSSVLETITDLRSPWVLCDIDLSRIEQVPDADDLVDLHDKVSALNRKLLLVELCAKTLDQFVGGTGKWYRKYHDQPMKLASKLFPGVYRKDLVKAMAGCIDNGSALGYGLLMRDKVPVDWIINFYRTQHSTRQYWPNCVKHLTRRVDRSSLRRLLNADSEQLSDLEVLGIQELILPDHIANVRDMVDNLRRQRRRIAEERERIWREQRIENTIADDKRLADTRAQMVTYSRETFEGTTGNGLRVVAAGDARTLLEWGELMENCIGGYASHLRHESLLGVYDGDTLIATAQVVDDRIAQLYGYRNRNLPTDVDADVRGYLQACMQTSDRVAVAV